MDQRLSRLTGLMLLQRIGLGAFIAVAPDVARRLFGAPAEMGNPLLHFTARLFGIRNVALGVILWESRHDPERLERVASLNAGVELLDATAAAVPLARRQGVDRAALSGALLSAIVACAFLALRAAARTSRQSPAPQ